MANLGPIPIPDPPTIAPFPLRSDWGGGMDADIPIVIHSFDKAPIGAAPLPPTLAIEQRFVLGDGARRFRLRRDHLSCTEHDQLRDHFIQAQGVYAQFNYTYWRSHFHNETVLVRYENPALSFPYMLGLITGGPGVTLLEIPPPQAPYASAGTVTRFPDSTLTEALRAQTQRLIPLLKIQPRKATEAPIYLSNQRITVDGISYLPRLLDWSGISQTIGESSDNAQFTFGNADGIWEKYVNVVNLEKARVSFSLFHVNSRYIVKLWSGDALPWTVDNEGRFTLAAADGAYELALGYPTRTITRACWKVYKGRYCPSTSPLPTCPKSWEACVERGVPKSFGGAVVTPSQVRIKDNSTGTWGWGRSNLTSVTIVQDTIYQRSVQEVWTDVPMNVSCDVAAGRDESDFYSALGIVGEGPISGYSTDLIRHRLDSQPPHDPLRNGGWRGIPGNDPAATGDFFGLDQSPWGAPPPGATYSGGLAFAEIRRTDEKGLQLSKVADRNMTVVVTGGIGGWTWTAPGNRVWTPALTNFVWVLVNVWLRAKGLRVDQPRAAAVSPAEMEKYFDVAQAILMAEVADRMVDKMVGVGQERQFPFRGIFKERKPLKDWMQEICNCGLGYFTFVDGKLWIGIRYHSGASDAFTRDNILYKSLQIAPHQAGFNWLTGQFGDEEFDFQLNNVTVYDIDNALHVGSPDSPEYHTSSMTFVGISNKSQCARVVTTRLREELGGSTLAEQLKARDFSFRTTILALHTMAGDVISVTDPRLPDGLIEGRVQKWTLNPDWSVDLQCSPTTNSMYDYTAEPKPSDVAAPPPSLIGLVSINGLTWMPNEVAPDPADPLYPDDAQRTFELWQDYNITRDGQWDAALYIAGKMPINALAAGNQPRITGAQLAPGGTLDGPMTVYVALTQRITGGQPLPPSNLIGLYIPQGVTDQRIQLTVSPSADGLATLDLWAGTDRRAIALQESGIAAATSVSFTGPIKAMTEGLPESAARKIAIAAKLVHHSGVAGVLVTEVIAPNKIRARDFTGSTDNWVGRPLSALADQSDGSAPLWNFMVDAFDPGTGEFTVSPDCVRASPDDSVEAGDVLIARSMAVAVSSDSATITDPMWDNSVGRLQFDSPGLRPDEEIGRICRIMHGTGAGQYRAVVANTATSITVSPPFDVKPDATSVVIVESPDWIYTTQTSDLFTSRNDLRVELRMRVENLRDHVALVGGFLVDDQERLSDEIVAPMREIYVFGQPPTVRVIGPSAGPWASVATDHTIRADTSETDVLLELSPLYAYQGRTLYIVNDNGPNLLIVTCAPGEFLFDGNESVTVAPLETVKVTAG